MDTFKQYKILRLVYPYLNDLALMFVHMEDDRVEELFQLTELDSLESIAILIHKLFDDYIKAEILTGVSFPTATIKYAEMYSGLSWLLRPVETGMIQYKDLKDGSLTMLDIKIMNDYLTVQNYNSNQGVGER